MSTPIREVHPSHTFSERIVVGKTRVRLRSFPFASGTIMEKQEPLQVGEMKTSPKFKIVYDASKFGTSGWLSTDDFVELSNNDEEKTGNRKIIYAKEYIRIYDPRISKYPASHQMFHDLQDYLSDAGGEWIQVKVEKMQEVITILDHYPEEPKK